MGIYSYIGSGKTFREIPHSLRRTTAPTGIPLQIGEARRALDLGGTTTEDSEIMENLPVAVQMVEVDSQRALLNGTWKLYMDEFPDKTIELRMPPVNTVTSVVYTDVDGASQTYSSSNYDTDLISTPARITPAVATTGWPNTKEITNAVTVTFTAGYSSEPVPPVAWKAVLLALKSVYYGCMVGDAYWSMIDRIRWESGL